jgi:pantothenate kinase type III
MVLTIDIGNTNISLGVYQGEELGPCWRVSIDHVKFIEQGETQSLCVESYQSEQAFLHKYASTHFQQGVH